MIDNQHNTYNLHYDVDNYISKFYPHLDSATFWAEIEWFVASSCYIIEPGTFQRLGFKETCFEESGYKNEYLLVGLNFYINNRKWFADFCNIETSKIITTKIYKALRFAHRLNN